MTVLEIPVDDVCAHKNCSEDATEAFIVAAPFGESGIGVYCKDHASSYADESENHTAIASVAPHTE